MVLLFADASLAVTATVAYDFNDVGQMADWTVADSWTDLPGSGGVLQTTEETWLSTEGVDDSGCVKVLYSDVTGGPPPATITLDAYTFEKASAKISFSVQRNSPENFHVKLGDAFFFYQTGDGWLAGDQASLGHGSWRLHYEPADPNVNYEEIVISIRDGIADITIDGVVLAYQADWNDLLTATGNTFQVTSQTTSHVWFDNYSQGPADPPLVDPDVVLYDFNDIGQLDDWTVTDNYDGFLAPVSELNSWIPTGGLGNSGGLRLLHNGVQPSCKAVLDAYTFDRDLAEIRFFLAQNPPTRFIIRLGGAAFFHQTGAGWLAWDEDSAGGGVWSKGTVFNTSAILPFDPEYSGALYNEITIKITDGIAAITCNGEDVVVGADWNALLSPTGNTFDLRIDQISFAHFDHFSYKLFIPEVCGDPGTGYFAYDISGPDGTPDCYVNLHDFAVLASEWLACTDPGNPSCTHYWQ